MKKPPTKPAGWAKKSAKWQHFGITGKAIVKKWKVYKNESSMHIQGFFLTFSLADKHLGKNMRLIFIIH